MKLVFIWAARVLAIYWALVVGERVVIAYRKMKEKDQDKNNLWR